MKNNNLKNSIIALVEEIKKCVIRDYKLDDDLRKDLLSSYNQYQESELDGVDYIFDVTNKEDVLNTDLEVGDVVELYNDYMNKKTTGYFMYGYNRETPYVFKTMEELDNHIRSWINEIIEHIVVYPSICESHKRIYDKYIYETIML